MKKTTLLFFLMLVSSLTFGQTVNDAANWPNTAWTVSGTYNATYLYSDPTTDSNFSFDDDDAGSGSNNDVAAESPVIDLTAAYTAGEYYLYFTAPYVYTQFTNASITVQYWDADAAQWTSWIAPFNVSTPSASYSNYCSATFATLESGSLDFSGFTATQLSGFKYRIYFDDGDAYAYGFCFQSPTIYSTGCANPSTLTVDNITNNSADIGWTENGSATKWNIEYGATGYTQGTGTTNTSTTNPYNLSGLTANTTYDVYVQADCGGGSTSGWIGPITFTTLCDPAIAPYTEGFENAGAIPSCWMQGENNAENWIFATSGGHVGNAGTLSGTTDTNSYFAYVDDSTTDNLGTSLLSPLVDVTALTTPSLSFYIISNNEGHSNVSFSVDIFDGTTWHNDVYTSNTNKLSWTKIYLDLTTYATSGFVQARFVVDEDNASGDYYDDLAIDDITFDELPSCIEPMDVMVTELTDTTAIVDLTQTGTSNGWTIEYGPAGFTQGTGTTEAMAAVPYTISLLTEQTDYEYYVQTDCGGGDTSAWVGPFSFTTLCAPFVAPFYEDFETSGSTIPTCWAQGEDNAENWIFATSAGYAGPGSSPSGGYFAYVDDSSANNIGTALVTPLVDVSTLTTPALVFYYNSDNGDDSNVDFSVDFFDGANWNNDVYFSNTDTNQWQYTMVDLSTFTITGPVKVRFVVDENNGTDFENDLTLDDISIIEMPTCPPVMNLAVDATTIDSATLSWTTLGSEAQWLIEYGYEGFTPGDGTLVVADTNPYLLESLESGTTYDYYVTAACSATSETSLVTGPFTFMTDCSIYPAPFLETFEHDGAIPNCWAQGENNAENWIFATSAGYVGNSGTITGSTTSNGYFAYVDDSSANNLGTTLQTPLVDVSSLVTPALIFYIISDNQGETSVDFSVDFYDGANWNTAIFTSNTNTNGWKLISIDLSAYTITGPVQARFIVDENNTTYYDDLAIDDVMFDELPDCTIPSDLAIANITSYGADISWIENGGATAWNLEYGLEGFTQGTGTTINVATNPATLEGLVDGTTYDVYVQADCGTDTSLWVGPITFTTACLPFGDFTENFDTTADGDMTLCWTGLVNSTNAYAYVEADTYNSYSSPMNMYMYNSGDTSGDILLVSPMLTDLPNGTHRAKFMALGSAYSTYTIEVGTLSDITDPSTFTLVESFDLNGAYQLITVDFDAPTTDSYVAIRHGMTSTYQSIRIDDFVWTAIPTTAPACATNVVATPDESCGNFENTISWDTAGDADGYYLTIGTTAGGTDILDNEDLAYASSYTFVGDLATTYYYTVTPYNSFAPATGCTEASFTTEATGCYCTSVPTSNDGSGITNVTLAGTDFPNADVTYTDNSATVVTVGQGLTVPVSIDFATGFTYDTNIWIDFNDNYIFETGEQVFDGVSLSTNPTTLDASFTLSSSAILGQHRMRIGTADSGQSTPNPCYNGSWGVTIDFTVDITVATCTPATVASTTVVEDCATSTFTVDVDVTDLGDGTPSITDGTDTWPVSATGIVTVGPFDFGTTATLEMLHGVNDICDVPVGTFTFAACPPANDDLCNATPLTITAYADAGTSAGDTYTNVAATAQTDEPAGSCFNSGVNGSVWFSFVAPASGVVTVTTDLAGASLTDTEIAVYESNGVTCSDLSTLGSAIGCDQDSGTIVNFNSVITELSVTPGDTYYIQVDQWGTATPGTFGIEVIEIPGSSVSDFADFSFNYYPNPVNNNKLTLQSEKEISHVSVYNLVGQQVLDLTPNTSNYVVNMSELSSGAYFVKVTIDGNSQTIKIIKE